jgi:hypothetical protein
MKKLFLAVLCAGLFFACGNKKQQTENLVDSTACQQEMVEETPAVEEQEPVAEVQEPAPAPAKKTTTTAKKTTTNNNGMTAGKTNEAPTVEQHAKDAANRVANKAIDKAETESTNAIVNSGKKKR